jgi:hypothetical protein
VTLMRWGRLLLVWGVVMAIVSFAPALLLTVLPGFNAEFLRLIATLLTLTVTPLGVVIASVGAILLLLAVLRRDRS